MKYISFIHQSVESIGFLIENDTKVVDIHKISNGELPNRMSSYLQDFEKNSSHLKQLIKTNKINSKSIIVLNEIAIKAPLKNPNSFRDAYAFRKHVEAGRKSRGLEMIPEYDQFPVFYYF